MVKNEVLIFLLWSCVALQDLEGSLAAARAEISEVAAQRAAAQTKAATATTTLQASSKGAASTTLVALVHFIYLFAGILAFIADTLAKLADSM